MQFKVLSFIQFVFICLYLSMASFRLGAVIGHSHESTITCLVDGIEKSIFCLLSVNSMFNYRQTVAQANIKTKGQRSSRQHRVTHR